MRNPMSKLAALVACLAIFGAAFAADEPTPAAKTPAPTKEQREQMAKVHEHMAACLRSDKTVWECHDAARQECQAAMGGQCAMMGSMMGPMNGPMGPQHHMNKYREDGVPNPKPAE